MKTIPSHLHSQLDAVFNMVEVGDLINFDTTEGQAMCGKKARIVSKAHSVVAGGTNPYDHISFWVEKENGNKMYFTCASTLSYSKVKKGVVFKGMLRDGAVVSGVISGFGL